ncbi:XPG-I domain [Dillenia turbinata]|uniref:XPG-I domain n=1 Tax=Dillenia turbinata TaxID=194707 RepID=A0AAN8UMT3_9MAGN
MGGGGNFWDLLKPYGRREGFDFLRNKRVAVNLSSWIVQHEIAIKTHVRNPHLRLTFFRAINLFSKSQSENFQVLPYGVDVPTLSMPEHGVSVARISAFVRWVQECVELPELLGMPALKAKGEAEAFCAQLNRDGFVDACATTDSDAFLYGAKCIVKSIHPNLKERMEWSDISNVEDGLGIKREHFIAISLLVGSDHNLNGVQGIGPFTAFCLVKAFEADEILNRHVVKDENSTLLLLLASGQQKSSFKGFLSGGCQFLSMCSLSKAHYDILMGGMKRKGSEET